MSTIAIITFVSICLLAAWLVWEMGNAKRALHAIRSMHSSIGQEIRSENRLPLKKMIENYKEEKPWYLRLKERLKEITKARNTRTDKSSQVAPHQSDDLDSNPESAS